MSIDVLEWPLRDGGLADDGKERLQLCKPTCWNHGFTDLNYAVKAKLFGTHGLSLRLGDRAAHDLSIH